jgi:general stress protein 26
MGDVKNLREKEAISKLKEIAEGTDMCMFCTGVDEFPFSTRPMSTQEVDEEGNLWFLSNKESHKNSDIQSDGKVQLIYNNTSSYSFLSVAGTASVLYDKAKIDELWKPLFKTWFQEGKDDPNITLIKIRPTEAHYWETKDGKIVSFLKMAAGAITGKEFDTGVEGDLQA